MSLIEIFYLLGLTLYVSVEFLGTTTYSIVYYGKSRTSLHVPVFIGDVPKCRFKDIYKTGLLVISIAYVQMIRNYFYDVPISDLLEGLLDFFGGTNRQSEQTKLATFVGLSLMLLQMIRRFYETHFLQVFSKTARMNFFFYLATLTYYPWLITGILVSAPGFIRGSQDAEGAIDWGELLNSKMILGITLFLFAWYHQFQSNIILVNLRKDPSGEIVTDQHFVPFGGFFEYISSPHMLFEILSYIGLFLVIPGNLNVLLNSLFVIANQLQYAKSTQRYYLKTFAEYPKNRRILIPYIY